MRIRTTAAVAIFSLAATGLVFWGLPVAAQPDAADVDLNSGNVADGREIYNRVCITCHGDRAQGDPDLNAPRLIGQEPWYLARQLKNFKQGIRGADERDIYGLQMRPMALTLQGDQDIADLVAFITSLNGSGR